LIVFKELFIIRKNICFLWRDPEKVERFSKHLFKGTLKFLRLSIFSEEGPILIVCFLHRQRREASEPGMGGRVGDLDVDRDDERRLSRQAFHVRGNPI